MKTGWILVGSGTAALLLGIAATKEDTDEHPSGNTVPKILPFTGITTLTAGIVTVAIGAVIRDKYYFIAAKSEFIPRVSAGSFVYRKMPANGLHIKL